MNTELNLKDSSFEYILLFEDKEFGDIVHQVLFEEMPNISSYLEVFSELSEYVEEDVVIENIIPILLNKEDYLEIFNNIITKDYVEH